MYRIRRVCQRQTRCLSRCDPPPYRETPLTTSHDSLTTGEGVPMRGTMMEFPLTLQLVFERGTSLFADREIVTGGLTGQHRYTYGDFGQRVHRLANALKHIGLKPGDR